MLFIKSKIQFFESKSQRVNSSSRFNVCCLSSQRYNFLKANHNLFVYPDWPPEVVYQVKDTIFWKQITTEILTVFYLFRCLSSQRYNFLKANHNSYRTLEYIYLVVYQVKDTIFWKQITTAIAVPQSPSVLFIKSKIQFFESKSQLLSTSSKTSFCCLSSQRYNFLKANHNIPIEGTDCKIVVYQVKDTIFWKQITTKRTRWNNLWRLFIKSKIQFFESKSQLLPIIINPSDGCLSSQRYNFLKANHNSSW